MQEGGVQTDSKYFMKGGGVRTGKTAMEEGVYQRIPIILSNGEQMVGMGRRPTVMGQRPTKPRGVARMKGE